MDQDGSGDISQQEFLKHAADSQMVAFASSLDLDVTDIFSGTQFYPVEASTQWMLIHLLVAA